MAGVQSSLSVLFQAWDLLTMATLLCSTVTSCGVQTGLAGMSTITGGRRVHQHHLHNCHVRQVRLRGSTWPPHLQPTHLNLK